MEGELCRLANAPDKAAAFVKLGFAAKGHKLPRLRTVRDWHRSGVETYSYVFAVVSGPGIERKFRLKACAPLFQNASIESILQSWILRREALAAENVSVPKLIASGLGLILEEEIPLHVSVALRSAGAEKVLAQLLNIAAAIARLRFLPVSGFADIRSRGDDAVYVDFGSDLGPPHRLAASSDMIFKQFHEQFETWRYPLTLEQAGDFREKFLARLGSSLQ